MAHELLRYAVDTAADLSDTLHNPAVRDAVVACSCASVAPGSMCPACTARHHAAQLLASLREVLAQQLALEPGRAGDVPPRLIDQKAQ